MTAVPIPIKNCSVLEKLQFYDNLIAEGDMDDEQLRTIRSRIYKIDTYFKPFEAIALKVQILRCIKELLL